jgi:hypothetical protein
MKVTFFSQATDEMRTKSLPPDSNTMVVLLHARTDTHRVSTALPRHVFGERLISSDWPPMSPDLTPVDMQ